MEPTLLDFYGFGRSAVQLYPENLDKPCLQPQAFRVLQKEKGSEIFAENLGAVPTDADNPFFWSRQWQRNKFNPNKLGFEWPIVYMCELVSETQGSPFERGFKRCHTIEIGVLAAFAEDKCGLPGADYCESRTINQIFMDTGAILDSVLLYFGGIVAATTTTDFVKKFYYLPWLENEKSRGKIRGFDASYFLRNSLNADNKRARFARIERNANKIYGTKTIINFCTNNCVTVKYDRALDDFGTISFEGGCKDCE